MFESKVQDLQKTFLGSRSMIQDAQRLLLGNLGSSKPGSKIQDLATLLEKSWVLDPRIQDSWAVLAPGNLDLGSTEPRFLGQDPQDILDLGSAKMDSPDFRKISPDFRKISPDFRKTSPDLSGKGLDTAKPIENIGLGGTMYMYLYLQIIQRCISKVQASQALQLKVGKIVRDWGA